MDSYESSTNSFIVKVWVENTGNDSSPPLWRGHITHVPSSERRYVQDLESISVFIGAYLQDMGVEGDHISKGLKGWLRGRNA